MPTIYIDGTPKKVPYSSLPPAKVHKPLRWLCAKDSTRKRIGNGGYRIKFGKFAILARTASQRGDGWLVNHMALTYNNHILAK